MHEDRTVLGPFHGDGVIELAHKRASARRGQQNRSASDESFSVQGGVFKGAGKLHSYFSFTSRSRAVGSNFPRLNFRQQSRHATARLILRTRGNSLPHREQR